MNSIITLPKLVELLSKATGTDNQQAEKFVIDFTNLIIEVLATDASVRIKGFGTFVRQESFGKTIVKFEPEKETTDHINAPFSCFEPVALADGVSADMLDMSTKEAPEPADQDDETELGSIIDGANAESDTDEPLHLVDDTRSGDTLVADTKEEADKSAAEEAPSAADEAESTLPPMNDDDTTAKTVDLQFKETASTEDASSASEPDTVADKHTDTVAASEPDTAAASEPDAAADKQTDTPANESKIAHISTLYPPRKSQEAESREAKKPIPPHIAYDYYEDQEPSSPNPWFWLSVAFILGLLIGFGVGYFCHDPIAARTYSEAKERLGVDEGLEAEPLDAAEDTTAIDSAAIAASIVDVPEAAAASEAPAAKAAPEAKPSVTDTPKPQATETPAKQPQPEADGAPVYDSVPAGGTLQTLASKHYGSKCYWVYIYEENKDKISNPNNVRQGLKLRIPPRSKYDVSTVEAENQAAAKKKSAEILSKHN